MDLILRSLLGIPLIQPGDDLCTILNNALIENQIELESGDIIVVAQKIVSKAENRLYYLPEVQPSGEALRLASITGKDPRLVELILRESKEVLRADRGLLIVEHKLGFVCANAGIDHSNVRGPWGSQTDWYLLLPEDPDTSARRLRQYFRDTQSVDIGILIIDSHGRAWRNGVLGTTIGLAGVPGIIDMRGTQDLFGYELKSTTIAAADELAASASLMMGQAAEKIPAMHVRGFPYSLRDSSLDELLRAKERDLFR